MRGLITANLKVLVTYPNDNDELIIAKRDGLGSNIHVVGLADLTSLYNSFSPILKNECNCSSADLQCTKDLMQYCS